MWGRSQKGRGEGRWGRAGGEHERGKGWEESRGMLRAVGEQEERSRGKEESDVNWERGGEEGDGEREQEGRGG